MMNNIQIIKLPPERWNEYKTLWLRALKEDPQAFGDSYADKIIAPDESWKKNLQDTMLFATNETDLVGMLGIWQSAQDKENKTANVFGVYVVPEYRGKGISKMLMQSLLNELKVNPNITKLKLTVNKDQLAAVKLYQGFGFEIKSQEKARLGDGNYYDEYLMEKDL
jgi:ribosomal protein S18 acetylase RimI-like enzyme